MEKKRNMNNGDSVKILKLKKKTDYFPYIIAAPALLFLAIGMIYPMLWSIYYSFFDKRVALEPVFNGIENYKYIFQDDVYWRSIKNTVWFTVGSMAGKVFLGVIVALILNSNIRFRNLLRTLFLLPWTLPSVVAIYTWMFLYSGNGGGLINNMLLNWGLIEKGVGWLSDPRISIIALMIVNIWRGVPFIALTVLSGLQTIPTELYESSAIDGANGWKSFWRITFPMVLPTILVATLISTIWTINDFETVYLLTGGGPGQSTYTIPILANRYAFDSAFGSIGRASAASVSTLPVMILLMIPILRNMLGDEEALRKQAEKRRRKEAKAAKRLEKQQRKEAA